nr:hypothetical transcript [Hymenolepis microstoma]
MVVDFPIFRLYHPDTRTYVSKSNNSHEILATERFLFSRLIEWEWIPLKRNSGIYLRNKANKLYLCFDKYGKPIARESIEEHHCLLRGLTPVADDDANKSPFAIDNKDGAIYLVSKSYSPPWITGFCPNGNGYANDDPLLPRCHHNDLSKNWSMLYLCPILPEDCRKDMCLYSNHLFDKYYTGCPHRCTYSIQCGGLLTRKYGNVEFD